MTKTNDFETATTDYSNKYKPRFSSEANMTYRFESAEALIEDTEVLSKMIQHHQEHQVKRLKVLQEYYEAENTNIFRGVRRREEHLADHRAAHGFGEYVSSFIQGYLVGIPLKTTYLNDDAIDERLMDINRINDADEHNSDLVLDQSIFGRAYELIYRNHDDEVRFTLSDVKETFVIYDDTVDESPIAGVRYVHNKFKDETLVYLYTEDKLNTYSLGNDYTLRLIDESKHYFGGVTINEYSNNRFRKGDFERELNLIDLYDEAQSDTSNYMTDLNDAMLMIKGNVDIDEKQAKRMKEFNLLLLQTEPNTDGASNQADASYIYKQYDVAGTEAYKNRVANDIHMFTSTPNMNDENFGGIQSGEAMKYKLFGLEQKRATKERLFKKALRNRYRLINNITSIAKEAKFDVSDISIVFTPNLPKSMIDEIEAFVKLGGNLSEETKLTILSIVENPAEEMERMANEDKLNKDPYKFPEVDGPDEEEVE